jgi:mitogen-activated protein kinase 7
LAEIAPIGKYIVDMHSTAADAPPSEMPRDFGMSDYEMYGADDHGRGETLVEDEKKEREKDGIFRIA